MNQSIENKLLKKIRGKDSGWAFSQRDFANLGTRSAIDVALHRLQEKGVVRRALRGIYEYPRFSELLNGNLSPDVDQVAQALARKFGWRIQPSGPVAQNVLGLSTQVPARFIYLSDGPHRSYQMGQALLEFKHTALKEVGFKHRESALIVPALKSLGADRITPQVKTRIRHWLPPDRRKKVLADTQTVTGWVYSAIQEICREDING
jgi:hypothetical protein